MGTDVKYRRYLADSLVYKAKITHIFFKLVRKYRSRFKREIFSLIPIVLFRIPISDWHSHGVFRPRKIVPSPLLSI